MSDSAEISLPRRQFLRAQFLKSLQSEQVKTQGFQGIRPPWSVVEQDFVANCTHCGDCLKVCETQILVQGAGGFPEVKFSYGECTFCGECLKACQQPVFRSMTEIPWEHRITIEASCLVLKGVECRSCEDSCPQRVIRFKRELGGLARPQLTLSNCNGCGACMSICPVTAIKLVRNQHE